MSDFCIVILAAGEGKRMKSDVPKVLHSVGTKPMIGHVVDAARAVRPKKIIVVLGRKRPQVRKALDAGIAVAVQEEPLGTADAMKAARKDLPAHVEDVIVLYGDTPLITEATIRRLYQAHRDAAASCTVVTAFLENPSGYGRILRNEAGHFVGIIEDKDASHAQKAIREINSGIYCFRKDALLEGLEHVKPLSRSGEFYLTDVFSGLYHKGKKIQAVIADDSLEVLGVNSHAELMRAQEVLRDRVLERHAAQGVRLMDTRTIFIDPSVAIGTGTTIYPFTYIEKDVVIGRDCRVGPFCHLREGAVLKDRAEVGNFTEVKNTTLGEETFMHHASYVGDARVGRKVNIGAGMVIANFDGRKKNKTVIKDRAFLGCNAVLVAPVTIGRNAVVGAGSVVTKNHNVPDGATVVGVPARVVKGRKDKS